MGGACSTHERHEKCIQNFIIKHKGKGLLGSSRRRWEDTIIMDLKETGLEVLDWLHLVQDR
jgi:hypothetical protein